MKYLRQTWYVAAWGSEIMDKPFARKILNEPVVFFRQTNGEIAAIGGRCPHRFAPLHQGKILGDTLQCPYHGLQFDASGTCVQNPVGKKTIPQAAHVPSYAVAERHGFLWIWMGDAERADPALIPDYSILDDKNWAHATGGYLLSEGHYELMVDNLLDVTHVIFLHPNFGNPSMAENELDVVSTDRMVRANLWMPDTECPPFLVDSFPSGQLIDQWLDMRWTAPSNLLLDFGLTTAGGQRKDGFQGWAMHLLTPETDQTAHYFFGISRPKGPGAEEMVARDHQMQIQALTTEDKPMVQACQQMIGDADFWSLKPVLLPNDAAAVRARRTLQNLIAQEEASTRKPVLQAAK